MRAALFASFTLLLVAGCSNNRENIEKVLLADAATTPNAKSVSEVVTRMRAIPLADCPADFSEAYLSHVHAWESAAEVEKESQAYNANYNSTGAFAEAFVRGFFGDFFGKMNEASADGKRLKQHIDEADMRVKQTYRRVEEIAVRYGATLPKRTSAP